MRDRHTLRATRRTRGVDHVRRVARANRRHRSASVTASAEYPASVWSVSGASSTSHSHPRRADPAHTPSAGNTQQRSRIRRACTRSGRPDSSDPPARTPHRSSPPPTPPAPSRTSAATPAPPASSGPDTATDQQSRQPVRRLVQLRVRAASGPRTAPPPHPAIARHTLPSAAPPTTPPASTPAPCDPGQRRELRRRRGCSISPTAHRGIGDDRLEHPHQAPTELDHRRLVEQVGGVGQSHPPARRRAPSSGQRDLQIELRGIDHRRRARPPSSPGSSNRGRT